MDLKEHDGDYGELKDDTSYDIIAVDFSDTYSLNDSFSLTEFNTRNGYEYEADSQNDPTSHSFE